jgi:hypothetical protein
MFLHLVACSTPQRQPWHQAMDYCVWTEALTCVGKCMKILASHDEMDYRLNWRLTRLSQTHGMHHWKWWAYDGRLYWEEKVFISDSNLSWVLFFFYFAPQNQSYKEEELETVTSKLFEFIYIVRLIKLTRILCVLYVHYNAIHSIFMAVMKEM